MMGPLACFDGGLLFAQATMAPIMAAFWLVALLGWWPSLALSFCVFAAVRIKAALK